MGGDVKMVPPAAGAERRANCDGATLLHSEPISSSRCNWDWRQSIAGKRDSNGRQSKASSALVRATTAATFR